MKKIFRLGLIFLPLAAIQCSAVAFSFRISPAPDWDQFFQRTNGWIGADAAYSVPLSTNKTLWLFDDTFVGRTQDGKRIHPRMIHSSIAIQPFGEAPVFYYPTNQNGEPESFVKSPDGKTDFWLLAGARAKRGLFFFMSQIAWTDSASVFGFRAVGTWLAFVENPEDPPARWKISKKKLPFDTLADGKTASFGVATLEKDGFIYVYGNGYREHSNDKKILILARAPENQFDDFSAWEFYSGGSWTKECQKAASIFFDAPPEGSVSWQPLLKKFIFIYTDGIWGKIVMRTAGAPEGPWGAPETIYQCPDMKISPKVFCYAGKAHPELSATNELLISYAANSFNFSEVINDDRLYWPRFFRVRYENQRAEIQNNLSPRIHSAK